MALHKMPLYAWYILVMALMIVFGFPPLILGSILLELERAAGLNAEDTALIVTSNGIARFLPDVVDVQPDDLDRKLKTGAWGVVEIDGATSCITSWNLRP